MNKADAHKKAPSARTLGASDNVKLTRKNVMNNTTAISVENNVRASSVVYLRDFVAARDGQASTTSIKVAEAFGKQHQHVTQKVEALDCSGQFLTSNFSPVSYEHRGNTYKSYEMTKDGFMFLVMSFTGKKAAQIKEGYIAAFNWMAEQLGTTGGEVLETVMHSTIGTNGFNMLGSIIKGKVAALPPHTRRQATMKIWAQAHVAFGVRSAQDIPADQLDAARNFIGAYALEGEWLAPEQPVAGIGGAYLPGEDLYQVYFLARHFNSLHRIFKESNLYQHLTGLGSKVGIDMIDHFKDGSFASSQLLTKYADQMDAHQRHRRINQYG